MVTTEEKIREHLKKVFELAEPGHKIEFYDSDGHSHIIELIEYAKEADKVEPIGWHYWHLLVDGEKYIVVALEKESKSQTFEPFNVEIKKE